MSVLTLQSLLVVLALIAVPQVTALNDSSSGESQPEGQHQLQKRCSEACPVGQRCRCLPPLATVIREQCPPLVCPSRCSSGAVITRDINGCKTCKCGAKRACKPVACRMMCPNGWAKGADGCDECRCKAPSKQTRCPLVQCNKACPYGYASDSNGCQTCRCNTDLGPLAS
ncbi:antistasin [Biomphalaria glabrata]